MKLLIGFSFIVMLILVSCNDDEDPTLLHIQPLNSHMAVKMNDVVSFNIEGTSVNNLKSFTITSKADQEYTKTILDSTISGKSFFLFYELKVPVYQKDAVELKLSFGIEDDKGNQSRIGKVLYVTGEDYLVETAGHVFYSHASEKHDAYDLLNEEPVYSELLDSSTVNVMDVSVDSIDGNSLRRKWESPSGIKFVRFNDYDYANATYETLRNAYLAGVKNDYLQDIKSEDVILTKADSCFMAIKISAVYDLDSTDMDRYVFNIKKVRN